MAIEAIRKIDRTKVVSVSDEKKGLTLELAYLG